MKNPKPILTLEGHVDSECGMLIVNLYSFSNVLIVRDALKRCGPLHRIILYHNYEGKASYTGSGGPYVPWNPSMPMNFHWRRDPLFPFVSIESCEFSIPYHRMTVDYYSDLKPEVRRALIESLRQGDVELKLP